MSRPSGSIVLPFRIKKASLAYGLSLSWRRSMGIINCTLTVDFWILFQNWWHQKTNETIKLSATHVLYGWHDRTRHWQALNYCLLIAKYCIFCTSVRGDVLDFQCFLLLLYGKPELLKEIATAKKHYQNVFSLGFFYFIFLKQKSCHCICEILFKLNDNIVYQNQFCEM